MNSPLYIRRYLQGFSLVEMMVAITIGLLLLVGLGTVYLGSRQTFRQQEALARMQEGARYAFEVMTLETRQAGYTGCAPKSNTYSSLTVSMPPDWFNDLATRPLFGYESGAGLPAVVTGELANTDALQVIRADESSDFRVRPNGHNPPSSAVIELNKNHGLNVGEILTAVSADCSYASTFQMTAAPATFKVQHNSGAGAPGNSTKCLSDPDSVPCASPATYPPLQDNSKIMRTRGTIFFLTNNTGGEPSLFREILTPTGTSEAEELIEGVENMQILYGEDTSTPINKNVDQYVTANAVTNWDNVFAVRVSLLMRSVENSVVNQPQAVMFNGATVNSGVGADRRLRKVFTTTIAVRNRL
ncbi:MAG: PilW family protein [Thiobacillus sp.]